MAADAEAQPARVASAALSEAAEKQEDGVVFTVFVIDVQWDTSSGRVATQVERRYSEFLSLYWELRRHQSVYAADFPRRLLWGRMNAAVIEDRTNRLRDWLRVISADEAALGDADFAAFAGPPPQAQQAQQPTPPAPPLPPVRSDETGRRPPTPDQEAERLLAELSDLDDKQLVRDLLGVTRDPILLRDLYAMQKEAPPPAHLQESVLARADWAKRWEADLAELNAKGYTDGARMAALLEAFAGDRDEACRHYDEMHRAGQ